MMILVGFEILSANGKPSQKLPKMSDVKVYSRGDASMISGTKLRKKLVYILDYIFGHT
jgi:hypothetical protein